MNLTETFLSFTLFGAEWVLWLLVVLSVFSVAVMIDRWRYFARRKVSFAKLTEDFRTNLASGDQESAARLYAGSDAIQVAVGLAGLREASRGPEAAAEAMTSTKMQKRPELERNLAFLGTLGNNAPFIGLFGTVLGIIKAFKDLSENTQAGEKAVMLGISEALVATAIGLLVALPAVMTYNYFNRRVRKALGESDALAHALLAELKGEKAPSRREVA